ncbi:MAG TPA: trypsin-like peptidase domain-containing protein, partial [Desulfobacterales bacterium]|nr:trypsin-like peptidase domain-containing protein [Desulfobacterales bacterium]
AYETRARANPFAGFGSPFFDEFFKDFLDPRLERRREHTSLGSGVIIDGERGLILTNAHVIQRSGTIKVVLQDEREYEARIIGADPDSDLAVLKIDPREKLPSIPMGSSDDLMIGETVIAIGNPFGFSHTVTTGVISALNRSIRTDERVFQDFIQIDASINPGNSGGPLLNINGELIGINTAIYAKAQGIGFAIPINKARRTVADLIQYGEVKQAWTGLVVQEMDEKIIQYLKYPGRKGVMVKAVEPESPAQRAGLREGDVLLGLGNRKMAGLDDYLSASKAAVAGDPLEIQIWRGGRTQTVSVKTSEFPIERADQLAWSLLGIKVEDLTPKNRRDFRIAAREGVLITEIRPGSQLARIGVKPGDLLRQIDESGIATHDEFRKVVVKVRQKPSLVLLIQRGEQGYYVTVSL